MKDPTSAVWPMVRAALIADEAVAAIVGTKIYDTPPAMDRTRQMPSISLGPTQPTPFGNDDLRGCSLYMQLDCWAEPTAVAAKPMNVVRALHEAVMAKVFGNQVASPNGWTLHFVWIDPARTQVLPIDPDGKTAHAIVTIRADMTPDEEA